MPINLHPPGADEIEISLFGPGLGESLVIHLGHGQWMIVDSCQPGGYQSPVPLSYLHQIGLDPSECVSTVVISHFHADHIKGMDEVVQACSNAQVWLSAALCSEEAASLVMAHSLDTAITDRQMPGTREMAKILSAMAAGDIAYRNAVESRPIYSEGGTVVTALSPSDAAINQARLDFAAALQELEKPGYKKLAKRLSPNRCAIALHVNTEAGAALLGADLEISKSSNLGWEAVLASIGRPQEKAVVYKVPHHGSETGHYEPIYQNMLENGHLSIITTMDSHYLPLPRDVDRICSYGGSVFCTTTPKVKPPRRDPMVEKILKNVVKKRRILQGDVGHIQVRMNASSGIVVNTNDLVCQLNVA